MESKRAVVVNIRRGERYDILVARPSKWGNPFQIDKDGTRQEVIEKYKEYFAKRQDLIEAIPELRGKRLGCYCTPLPCHADFLAELANKQPE